MLLPDSPGRVLAWQMSTLINRHLTQTDRQSAASRKCLRIEGFVQASSPFRPERGPVPCTKEQHSAYPFVWDRGGPRVSPMRSRRRRVAPLIIRLGRACSLSPSPGPGSWSKPNGEATDLVTALTRDAGLA